MKFDPSAITPKDLRVFGMLMAGIFLIVGVWPWVFKGESVRTWSASVSGLWAAAAIAVPRLLTPFYTLWMKFAEKLGWFNTRVLLGIIFYVVITPFSLVMRIFGKKPLHCTFEKQCESYRTTKKPREANHVLRAF